MNTSLLRIAGLGLFLLGTTTGCSHKDPVFTAEATIEVVSQIDQAQQTVAGRASTVLHASKSGFEANDQMGVWVLPYLNSDGANLLAAKWEAKDNYADNVPFVSNGTYFTPAVGKEVYYPTPVTLVDLYGVYPYNATMSAPTNNSMPDPKKFEFTLAKDQTTAASVVASDLMTAKAAQAKQGTSITMSFTHRLSRVLIKFAVPTLYRGHAVSGVSKVEVCNIPLRAVVDLSDVSVDAQAVATNNNPVDLLAYQAGKPDAGVVAGEYTYEAIVMPGTVVPSGANLVRVTLNVATLGEVAFDCKISNAYTYLATQLTQVTVAIADETAITLPAANVTIAAWGNNALPDIETVKPARMILDVTANANIAKAAQVKMATLTIDAITYTKVPATYDLTSQTITIVYPQSSKVFGYDLVSLALLDVSGTPISVTFTPTPSASAPKAILGNPTETGYNTKIGIAAAFN